MHTFEFVDKRPFHAFGKFCNCAITKRKAKVGECRVCSVTVNVCKCASQRNACIVAEDDEKDKVFVKAMQHTQRQQMIQTEMGQEIQIFRGSLKDGENLDTPSNIVILGNVDSGCRVFSEKSILIFGGLYGEAHAGYGTKDVSQVVIALEMAPEALSIGDFTYIPPQKAKWGKNKERQSAREIQTLKKTARAIAAKVQDDMIVLTEYTEEYLSAF